MEIKTLGGKGVATRTIVLVAIGVGGLLFGFIMLTGIGDARENIIAIILGLSDTAKGPPLELEAAIKCAYYRCIKSCDYAVNNVDDVGDFRCIDYCDPQETDTGTMGGTICDDDQRRGRCYPVQVTLEDDTTVKGFDTFEFLQVSNDCTGWIIYFIDNPVGEQIVIDERRIVEGQCDFGGMDNAVVECKIQAGTYYLWNQKEFDNFGFKEGDKIVVCSNYGAPECQP